MAEKNSVERRVVNSVQRAIDILGLFGPQVPELGITEIANALELHKSTASGLVYTLADNDYLEQNPENKKYRLGLRFIERATIVLGRLEIRRVAMPFLEHLRDWSNESINLGIRDHHEVIYIERMLSDQPLGIRAEIGKRSWVHCTGLGKAMLSRLPEDEARAILESYPLATLTEYTVTDIDKIMDELRISRQRGFAIDDQENELGGRCVSASILNYEGTPVAAVSISVPLPRIPPNRVSYYGNKVKATAAEISQQLGYRVPSS